MGFDRRGYYYRSIRDGGRVRRLYIGKGPVAQLAALLDDERRSQRQAQALAWRAEEARWEAAAARRRALDELGEMLARAALLAAGFHQHSRGAWRKRRMNGDSARNGEGLGPGATHGDGATSGPGQGCSHGGGPPPVDGHDPGDRPLSKDELRELLARAGQGDLAVLPALRRLLDFRPALWQLAGDVGWTALADWIDLIAAGDLLVRESLRRSVVAMEAQVAGPAPSPLEGLLAERVIAGWLQVSQADALLARSKGQGLSIAQLELMQRRQERAQRSYLAAIKTLAAVRRLGVAAAPAAAPGGVDAEPASPRRRRSQGGRAAAANGKHARGGRKEAAGGKTAERAAAVPKALRDRMRGLVGAEN